MVENGRMSTSTMNWFPDSAFDPSKIPDFDQDFLDSKDIDAFAKALDTPESSVVVALNDWKPVRQRVLRRRRALSRRKKPRRSRDETREGFVYAILKWPLLLLVMSWILSLAFFYLMTRFYIWTYERLVTWRGERQRLRRQLRSMTSYEAWKTAATELDAYLGNEQWKQTDDYAYYDFTSVMKVKEQLKATRVKALDEEKGDGAGLREAVQHLQSLVEACVKNNFVGVENPKLYSETYYGTKHLAQDFVDELHASLSFLLQSFNLSQLEKSALSKHLHTNFGKTALCLSGGASFAWYHFGVVKALLDASLLPDVITGTSGGALVAALVATRTNDELSKILVPALALHIDACEESFLIWGPRWWRTGARFDSLAWARKCSWFCRGSTTFREAYERTGRILNVTCVPSDPYSPTILMNYLTAPDCVIWTSVIASAAVPGILQPVPEAPPFVRRIFANKVVLMTKRRDGTLAPYSFGSRWKDGSLRTDIPLKALNLHFNVNFSIVSQVNPHISLFFFSSRGAVGRPVSHRRGRGWRGGFAGSAAETYLKLDLSKWLKVLRHLELLPRPLGQDWSGIWLQQFSGTVTIWPKSQISDFFYILSDPTPERLARMLQVGQQSTFPKLMFIANRMKIERLIEQGLLLGERGKLEDERTAMRDDENLHLREQAMRNHANTFYTEEQPTLGAPYRRSSAIEELKRQSGVFFDDPEANEEETDRSDGDSSTVEDELSKNL